MKLHNTFRDMVNAGAELIGSQNALAKYLGSNSGNLSNAKAGKVVLTVHQVELLALLIGDLPERVWALMQLNRLQHRSPFRDTVPPPHDEPDASQKAPAAPSSD